ncbi:MAG: hypothetical protein HFJ65_04210 [Eggerthellaceae bacterium]|nr:hypothetical protein [Eggerthellaceae bacterium]
MRATTQNSLVRKLISILLAIVMVASLMGISTAAFAEDPAETDGTNTEIQDPTVTEVDPDGNIIIEGDGTLDEEFGGFEGIDVPAGENGEGDSGMPDGSEGDEDAPEDEGVKELKLPDGIRINGTQALSADQQHIFIEDDGTRLVFDGGGSYTVEFYEVNEASESEQAQASSEEEQQAQTEELQSEENNESDEPSKTEEQASEPEPVDIDLHIEDGKPVLDVSIDVRGGTSVTLEGEGKVDATGQNRSAITVEGAGSTLTLKDNVIVTGGTGTLVHTSDFNESGMAGYVAGGGILVQRTANSVGNAKLFMEGGTVTGNEANAGGGIFIDRDCVFKMSGGTVSNNTAKVFEGGGIYVAGHSDGTEGSNACVISKGNITGNKTETSFSWGGGGIFVEVQGSVKIGTASITRNVANGLGGGVSGCPHAAIGIGAITEGAAIFKNTANYTDGRPSNKVLRLLKTHPIRTNEDVVYSGDMYAYGLEKGDVSPAYGGSTGEIARDQSGKWSSEGVDWAHYAQDFYCTKASHVYGNDLGQDNQNAWEGYIAGAETNQGYSEANSFGYSDSSQAEGFVLPGATLPVKKGDTIKVYDATLGLRSTATSDPKADERNVIITDNFSGTHGGGIGCNGTLSIDEPAAGEFVDSFSLEVTKQFKNSHGQPLKLEGGEFTFQLKDGDTVIASSTNDADGKVRFTIPGEKYINRDELGVAHIHNLKLCEVIPADSNITQEGGPREYDVKLSIVTERTQKKLNSSGSRYIFVYTPKVTVTYDNQGSDLTITNILNLKSNWLPDVNKNYFGQTDGANPAFSFSLTGITDPFADGVDSSATLDSLTRTEEPDATDVASVFTDEGGNKKFFMQVTNGEYADGTADVPFNNITYTTEGDRWYLLKEDGGQDPTVYVVKVKVEAETDDEGKTRALNAHVTDIWFAYGFEGQDLTVDDLDSFESEGSGNTVEFNNSDTSRSFAAFGYRVRAASNVAIDQQCLVDPKIWKQLEGGTLEGGEFQFSLIEVADLNSTDGLGFEVIARNDEYGMVDFDEAGNVAAPGEDPCCLSFNTPGTRYYRVIEDRNYENRPNVEYSNDDITFTVDVIRNDAGQLEVADMFYGKLVNGENIPFEDESKDPTWHPTITNKVRGMDLMVQKTSEADRTEGLEGAVYDLYMVSDGTQGDVFMGSGTSDADGWILYEDVNLMTGTPYYFKEKTPPAGHTVDGFRSLYFYLVPDSTAENGYTLKYVENLGDMGNESEDQERVTSMAASTQKARATEGNLLFTYAHDGGVYDAVTTLDFNKLDTRTHEWVEGAKLSILEKATGKLISSWTTGKGSHTISRQLDVDVEYILREDQAPDGYATAADVVFKLDQFGNVEILSGGGSNAEVQESTLTMYDTMFDTENVIYRMNETLREVPSTDGSRLPQTGDDSLGRIVAFTLLGVAALCLMTVAAFALRRRRKRDVR